MVAPDQNAKLFEARRKRGTSAKQNEWRKRECNATGE